MKWFKWKYLLFYLILVPIFLLRSYIGVGKISLFLGFLFLSHIAGSLYCFFGKNNKKDLGVINWIGLLWALVILQIFTLSMFLQSLWEWQGKGILDGIFTITAGVSWWDWLVLTIPIPAPILKPVHILIGENATDQIIFYLIRASILSIHIVLAATKPLKIAGELWVKWIRRDYTGVLESLRHYHFPVKKMWLLERIFCGILSKKNNEALKSFFEDLGKTQDLENLEWITEIAFDMNFDTRELAEEVEKTFLEAFASLRATLPDNSSTLGENTKKLIEKILQTPMEANQILGLKMLASTKGVKPEELKPLSKLFSFENYQFFSISHDLVSSALKEDKGTVKQLPNLLVLALFWCGTQDHNQWKDTVDQALWESQKHLLKHILETYHKVESDKGGILVESSTYEVLDVALSHSLKKIRIRACQILQVLKDVRFIEKLIHQRLNNEKESEVRKAIFDTLERMIPFSGVRRTREGWENWF